MSTNSGEVQFWVAPILGALFGGFVYRWLGADVPTKIVGEPIKR